VSAIKKVFAGLIRGSIEKYVTLLMKKDIVELVGDLLVGGDVFNFIVVSVHFHWQHAPHLDK
jgi:hypothetical protein